MLSSSRKRVLLVEDEPGFRDVLQIGLEPAGFDTEPAGGLAEAIGLLSAQTFDAVVSDLRLKDGSGIDLLAWIKERGLETPVVIMTAFATTETTVRALNLGAVDFLTKTKNDIQELTKVLKSLFAVSPPSSNYEISNIGDLIGVGETIRKIQALVGMSPGGQLTFQQTGMLHDSRLIV